MDKKIRKAYAKKRSGGRSAVAKYSDAVLLALIGFIATELILRGFGLSTAAAAIISAGVMCALIPAVHIVRDVTLDAYIKKERQRQRLKLCRERLVLLESDEFRRRACELAKSEFAGDFLLTPRQKMCAIDFDDVLAAMRAARAAGKKRVAFVSLSDVSEDVKSFATDIADKTGIEAVFCGSEQLLNYELERRPVSDAEADSAFIGEITAQRRTHRSFFKRFRLQSAAMPFFICGAVLFALSFIMRFSLLYRLLAATSIWLGAGKALIRSKNEQ